VKNNDAAAMHSLASIYWEGLLGMKKDMAKALNLFHLASKLNDRAAHSCLGHVYSAGDGVEKYEKKARHYWELAAMAGCSKSRYQLGVLETKDGNWDKAVKHWLFACDSGHAHALDRIRELFTKAFIAKEVYEHALRAYQKRQDEIRSTQRDEALRLGNWTVLK
jgi:tetratricopeptide (TPR) repeat protein